MMNTRSFLSIVLFGLFSANCSYAQNSADTGKISIIQDRRINELVKKHVEINSKIAVKGFRVKIHFGADKDIAKEIMAKFSSQFVKIPAYIKYDQPNFNVSVGNFRTKLEAFRFLKEIQTRFPSAFIVQEEIDISGLDSN